MSVYVLYYTLDTDRGAIHIRPKYVCPDSEIITPFKCKTVDLGK